MEHANMAKYYFDRFKSGEFPDEVGQICASEDAALALAMLYARDIAAVQARAGDLDFSEHIAVRDDAGETIVRITLAEALDVEGPFQGLMSLLPMLSLLPIATAAVSLCGTLV